MSEGPAADEDDELSVLLACEPLAPAPRARRPVVEDTQELPAVDASEAAAACVGPGAGMLRLPLLPVFRQRGGPSGRWSNHESGEEACVSLATVVSWQCRSVFRTGLMKALSDFPGERRARPRQPPRSGELPA